jgi:uncharacterized glyoxalase superfamily protein PhnB
MKPAPSNFPRITSMVAYDDAPKAIDWLCDVFGFQVRLKVEGDAGEIIHSELTYGEGVIMVATAKKASAGHEWLASVCSPKSLGGKTTHMLMLYVDDADAHCAHARSRGAHIAAEPSTSDYGEDYWCDRGYAAIDLEGHAWWIASRVRDPVRR